MQYRTDLALESLNCTPINSGITQKKRGRYFRITEINIQDDESGKPLNKGKGRYITLEGESLSGFSDDYEPMAQEFAEELRQLLPENGGILVAGLGNADITPDALGVKTVSKVLATRHLQKELEKEDEEFLKSLRSVAVISGGVLGQTGMESAELLSAIVEKIHPSAVIAVDALACSSLERLGTTIQISDTGISPGSGVNNRRKALNSQLMGIPVIAVGIPTVIGVQTITEDLTGENHFSQISDMMVTPRDVDRLISQSAHLLACGINLALHPQMNYADVASF